MDEQQYVALPKLYGAPAYARPPRPVETQERPFDPDDLPLEAFRTGEDSALVTSPVVAAGPVDGHGAVMVAPEPTTRAPELVERSVTASAPAPADPVEVGRPPALEPRPFSIRGLARRIRPR